MALYIALCIYKATRVYIHTRGLILVLLLVLLLLQLLVPLLVLPLMLLLVLLLYTRGIIYSLIYI